MTTTKQESRDSMQGVDENLSSSATSSHNVPVGNSNEASSAPRPTPEFEPTFIFYAAMSMLGLLTLAVALDATALAVALPVCRC